MIHSICNGRSWPSRPATSGASSKRAVTIADTGLPGRPITSVSPTRPNHTGLPGLIAILENKVLSPSGANIALA